ncbi:MAG: lysophospholipid acyltransferase family protein [Pseudomonadota bacterium]|nr:lysophospholipid acyltransferase family protein [Pseudomonadota bacterium]
MLRQVRANPLLRSLVARLGAGYIRLVDATSRWEVEGAASRALIRGASGRWIVPVWHGRLLIVPAEKTRAMNVLALISANRDGEIIAQCVERFGAAVLRGSSRDKRKPEKDKGGAAMAAEAIERLSAASDMVLVLTPDGPRGPRMRAKPGVAGLAIATGVPVIPFAYAVRGGWVLGSWDRFVLPLPFGRGAKVFGDPIAPPQDAGHAAQEAFRREVEAALNAVAARADLLAGRAPIEPDPEPGFIAEGDAGVSPGPAAA